MQSVSDLEQNREFMDLYSRQIGAYGMDAMLKLVNTRVLIVGLESVAIEAAKNIILAGVQSVTIHDNEVCSNVDLGYNFFVSPDDIGKKRTDVCIAPLKQLNSNVRVLASGIDELTEEFVAQHDVVIMTTGTRKEVCRWNSFCRSYSVDYTDGRGTPCTRQAPISFISVYSGGVVGSVFVDHGDQFVVRNPTGGEASVKIMEAVSIVTEEKTLANGETVTEQHSLVSYITPDGQLPTQLDSGYVTFSEVDGMFSRDEKIAREVGHSINTSGKWKIWKRDSDPPGVFRTGDTSMFSAYIGGGVITEVIEPVHLRFRSLADCIANPSSSPTGVVTTIEDEGFAPMDTMSFFMSGGIEQQLHIGVQAVFSFQERNGRLPAVNSDADADECLKIAKEFNESNKVIAEATPGARYASIYVEELKEDVIRNTALFAGVQLQPLGTFLGGVVAQEVVKMSGRYTPLHQFLHFHVMEALPNERPSEADRASRGSRYDSIIQVWGAAFHERLLKLKLFMIGCGALGCEYVKNFALLGVCCSKEGELTITDYDRIEVSNLNRQFLFREENVGHLKSEAAGGRASAMNAAINITALNEMVCTKTEKVFTDDFWLSQDVICNALDNMKARLYVDGRCVFYEKPLLESGTMGTGANVDIIIPHKTQSYSDGGAAQDGGGIPMCTLRNFPHLIDHCIEWSRAQFQDCFVSPAEQAKAFTADPADFIVQLKAETIDSADSTKSNAIALAIPRIQLLLKTLRKGCGKPTIDDCVSMAWDLYFSLFRDKIEDLTSKFPEDAVTSSGEPFWSGHKRFPKAVTAFSFKDEHSVSFLISATNLFASMVGLHPAKPASEHNDPANPWMAKYRDTNWLASVISKLEVPGYQKGATGDLDENSANEGNNDKDENEALLKKLIEELEKFGSAKASFVPADFEKDDDDNFHIDFITAASNLRARNYHIPEAPRHKCKMVAGKIIPAIATTTAAVTGLVMFEMFKVLLGKDIEALRNGNFDIGTNSFTLFEGNPPQKITSKCETVYDEDMFCEVEKREIAVPDPHTKYDRSYIDGVTDKSVQQVIDEVKALGPEGSVVYAVSVAAGDALVSLYHQYIPSTKRHLEKNILDVLKEFGVNLEGKKMTDVVSFNVQVQKTGDEVLLPKVVLRF